MTLVMGTSLPAAAQEPSESVEASAEQMKLNDQAVEAMIEDNYARAVALLEEARLMGEVNVVYLNLGRAYQKLGKCEEARGALDKAAEAPAASQPSPELVAEKIETYRAELDEQCPADTQLAEEDAVDQPETVEPPEASASSTAQAWEWAVLGGGAAVALGGVGVHFLAESKRADVIGEEAYEGDVNVTVTQQEAAALEEEANTLSMVSLGMIVAGGITTGVGTYLVLTGGEEAKSGVSMQLEEGGASIVWSGRF